MDVHSDHGPACEGMCHLSDEARARVATLRAQGHHEAAETLRHTGASPWWDQATGRE